MKKTTFLWAMSFLFGATLFAQTTAELTEIRANDALQTERIDVQELLARATANSTSALSVADQYSRAELDVLRSFYKSQNRNVLADIIPTAGATETFPVVTGDRFFDPGGPGGSSTGGTPGNYPNCGCVTLTTLTGVTDINFDFFSVFATFDWLKIYDGVDTTGAVLYDNSSTGAQSGDITTADMAASTGTAFTSTTGSLTFEFNATAVVDYGGWDVEINPGGTPPPPPANDLIAYGFEAFNLNVYGSFDPEAPEVFTTISLGANDTSLEIAGDVDPSNNTTAYVSTTAPNFYSLNLATGVYTLIGAQAQTFIGVAFDPTSGILYGVAADNNLYTIDTATGAETLVGPVGAAFALADIAITGDGDAYGHDIAGDLIVSLDLTTGAATAIGPTGFDANFAQGMTWDPNSDTVYLAAFNVANFLAEWRSVDLVTGATTIVGIINDPNDSEVTWAGIPLVVSNDECSGAIAMECGDTETGDTNDYTDTGGANASPDAWYSYTGSGAAELVTFSLCDGATSYDSLLTVFDSCGGTVVVGNDDSCGLQSEVSFLSDGTTTYYVAVEGFLTSAGAFSLTVSCNPVAANDLCDDAIAITCDETVLGSTEFATPDQGAPDCGAGNNSPGVWYVIDDATGLPTDYVVSLCDGGTAYDSKLVIFSGDDCGTLVCVAENDDECGLQSEVSFTSDGTSTYYILVNGFGSGSSGDFSLNLSCVPVPPFNDMIVNSIDVDEAGLPYTDPAVPMPAATTEAGGTPVNCDNAGVLGVWYNFVATNGGMATATVVSPAGYTSVTFYTAPDENAVETDLTLVDWFDNQCVPGVTTTIPVEAGQAYYVYVANHGGITDIVIDGDFLLGVGDAVVDGFTYFPNPANNELNLDAGIRSIDSATIYNILGQAVVDQNVGASSTRLDVANLSVGTYIMKVVVEGEVGIYKIVKQ